jgi:hypothetical protein
VLLMYNKIVNRCFLLTESHVINRRVSAATERCSSSVTPVSCILEVLGMSLSQDINHPN